MAKLVGLSGSLRRESLNTRLLEAAAALLPDGSTLDLASIRDVPLYDGDAEDRDGVPQAVERVKEAIAGADGVVIATPEYNAAMPGVLKNALDWISRPPADQARVLHGRPVALLGATPGRFGTAFAQTAWLGVLRALRMPLWSDHGSFLLPSAHRAFTEAGQLADADMASRLQAFVAGFVEHVDATRR